MDRIKENTRFYIGWGLIAIIFGISLVIFASFGGIGQAVVFFLTVTGVALFVFSLPKPQLPLIGIFGFIMALIGMAVYGIYIASLNSISIIGLLVIAIGGGIISSVLLRRG